MRIEQTVILDEKMLDVIVKQFITSRGIKTKLLYLNIAAALILALGVIFIIDADYLVGAIMLALGVFFVVFANILYKRLLQSNLKKMNESNLEKETNFILDDERIAVENPLGKNEYKWESVESVKEMDNYIGITMLNRALVLLEKEKLSEEEIEWLFMKAPKKKEGENKNA